MSSQNNIHQTDDDVRRKLHQAAMAERTPFSPEIHQRMMQGIHEPKLLPPSSRTNLAAWLTRVAAVLFLLAGVASISLWIHAHRSPAPTPAGAIVRDLPTSAPTPTPAATPLSGQPIQLAINLGGVVSARAWPPQISIGSPIVAADVSTPEPLPVQPIDSPLGSPEWLLARFQQPASSARAALIGLMPPSLHPPAE
jgi:hypothetical protein